MKTQLLHTLSVLAEQIAALPDDAPAATLWRLNIPNAADIQIEGVTCPLLNPINASIAATYPGVTSNQPVQGDGWLAEVLSVERPAPIHYLKSVFNGAESTWGEPVEESAVWNQYSQRPA